MQDRVRQSETCCSCSERRLQVGEEVNNHANPHPKNDPSSKFGKRAKDRIPASAWQVSVDTKGELIGNVWYHIQEPCTSQVSCVMELASSPRTPPDMIGFCVVKLNTSSFIPGLRTEPCSNYFSLFHFQSPAFLSAVSHFLLSTSLSSFIV